MNDTSLFGEIEVENVMRMGSDFLPQALGFDQLEQINREIDEIHWREQYQEQNPWLHFYDAKIQVRDHYPAINALRTQVEYTIWRLGERWPQLYDYRANEVTAQRYDDSLDGIGTHQDYSYDRLLIAVFNVRGWGGFEIMSARQGDNIFPVARYELSPGSLCLLSAPELTPGAEDLRPPHRADSDDGGRVSLTCRYVVRQP